MSGVSLDKWLLAKLTSPDYLAGPELVELECCECGKAIKMPKALADADSSCCHPCRQAHHPFDHERRKARLSQGRTTAWANQQAEIPKIFHDYPAGLVPPAKLEWWRGRPPVMTVLGPPGVGKTTHACEVLRRWLKRGGSGRYLMSSGAAQRVWDKEDLLHAGLLVMDDFAYESPEKSYGSAALETAGALIITRHAEGLPTLVLTNRPLDAIRSVLPPVADRLGEYTQTLGGASHRGK